MELFKIQIAPILEIGFEGSERCILKNKEYKVIVIPSLYKLFLFDDLSIFFAAWEFVYSIL